jgi:hypothetical protein
MCSTDISVTEDKDPLRQRVIILHLIRHGVRQGPYNMDPLVHTHLNPLQDANDSRPDTRRKAGE